MRVPHIILCIVIILLPYAFAGVTNPMPSRFNLSLNQSAKFSFQIQNILNNHTVQCNITKNSSANDIHITPKDLTIDAHTTATILGTVTSHKEGTHIIELCTTCKHKDYPQNITSKVEHQNCGLTIMVETPTNKTLKPLQEAVAKAPHTNKNQQIEAQTATYKLRPNKKKTHTRKTFTQSLAIIFTLIAIIITIIALMLRLIRNI